MRTFARCLLLVALALPFVARAQVFRLCAVEYRLAALLGADWDGRMQKTRITALPGTDAECRQQLLVGTSELGLMPESSLDVLFKELAIRAYGRTQPFGNIDPAFKRSDSNRANSIVWIGLGWITWNSLGALQPKGGCRPTEVWSSLVCAEKWSEEEFKIMHKAGHLGWAITGLGISRRIADSSEGDKVADAAAAAETSRIARSHFVIVADEKERKRRKVWFELWSPDGKTKFAESSASASEDARSGYPLPVSGQLTAGKGFDACGNPKAACPPYKVAPGDARQITEYLRKAAPTWR